MYEEKLNDLRSNLGLTKGENITDYSEGYISDVFSYIADNNVDIYTYDLFEWGKSNFEYIDEATREFGNPNDIIKQIQQGQYYAYEQELYDNKDDVLKLYAYTYLKDNDIKLNEEQQEDLEDYICALDTNNDLSDINDYCDSLNNDLEV